MGWRQGLTCGLVIAIQGACKGAAVDTSRVYYEDSEAPEYQLQIINGVKKKVPWRDVPPPSRYIVEWDVPPGPKPRVRIPIVEVHITAMDKQGRPVALDDAYSYRYVEIGLNPRYVVYGLGGKER